MTHSDVGKTGFGKSARRFFRITESEKWRTRRDGDIQVAVLLNGGEGDGKPQTLFGRIPHGESNVPAAAQYAECFTERHLGPAEMQHSEIQNDRVEAAGFERKSFRIAFAKNDAGITVPRLFHHLGRKVDADRHRASCCRCGRRVSRAASNVEYMRAFCHMRRIQQRIQRLPGHGRKTAVIPRSDLLPALVFELTEGLWIDLGHRRFLVFGLRGTRTATRNMTEARDIIAGQQHPVQFLYSFALEQNPELFVADFCALLKRDLVVACKHQCGNHERHSFGLLTNTRNRKIKAAAVCRTLKAEVANVLILFGVFHSAPPLYLIILISRSLSNDDVSLAWAYHNATKHSEWSVRSSPHYLDWANQPKSLKIYTMLDPIPLPREAEQSGISALSAIAETAIPPDREKSPSLSDLARLLYFSAGITKKKTYPGGEMYFRAASCTGALYEFELYLVCADVPDLPAGVYHFSPGDFSLRLLRAGDHRGVLVNSTALEDSIAHAPAIVVCAGTYWRNSWKYRARTYRHFGWDNGTILANLLAMAAALQVPAQVVLGFVDDEVNHLLALDTQREVAFSLVALGRVGAEPPEVPKEIPEMSFATVPLSENEVDYPELREIHAASSLQSFDEVAVWRARAKAGNPLPPAAAFSPRPDVTDSIEQVILRRGSTRKFQRLSITLEQLSTILQASTRGIWSGQALLNDIYLIVNAVDDMAAGAYVYHPVTNEFECLRQGNFRDEAAHLGLGQALPGDASVAVFFMANLTRIFERFGNRGYRAVQLEAGILGGKMYLAAYAQRLGATGLTFFDDDVTAFFSPHAKDKSPIFLIALGKGRKL
jgi:SagB-type dehydrogenase family enzyme